jgi:serine/threonine protein kinase
MTGGAAGALQVLAQGKGMGLPAWKSPRMGESRSSALHRVIRAGPDAQDPAGPDAQDPSTGADATEPTSLPEDSASPTIVVRRPVGAGRPAGPEPVLGRYGLIRRLGAGGFGTVWLAWDERLEREVALKLLPRERLLSGRFEREARVAARLNHPGIVVLYEAGMDDEGGYLVSELVRGDTLGRLLHDGRLSDRDIVHVTIALCDALEYAHRQGVIHRDVKPSNVLMPDAPSSPAGVAKLTDFGVARLIGGDSLTRTGDVVGTSAYMAPEQAEGLEADTTADLYSLSLVLYEALTGVNPVRLEGPSARGGRRLGTYLPAVRRHRRDLPRELACAVDLALRPRPRERGTVLELREALVLAADLVDDEPGVVEAPRLRFSRSAPTVDQIIPWPAPEPLELSPRPAPPYTAAPEQGTARDRPPQVIVKEIRPGPGPLARMLGAAAAAGATAWFASGVLTPAPVLPVVAVLVAALAVALLPRVGWLGLVMVGAGLLIEQNSPGGAVVLLLAAIPTALLLLRHPARWPLPAIVPALSLLGLAGVWPALAGRAATAWERLILGAAGWLWLVVGAFLSGQAEYLRLPAATVAPRAWMPSMYDTWHRVLHQLLSSGILLPGLAWGAGAVVLPWITARQPRAREPGDWAVRGALLLGWAATVALVTHGLLAAVAPAATMGTGEVILGVLACALVGAVPRPAALRQTLRHAQTPGHDSRSMEMR